MLKKMTGTRGTAPGQQQDRIVSVDNAQDSLVNSPNGTNGTDIYIKELVREKKDEASNAHELNLPQVAFCGPCGPAVPLQGLLGFVNSCVKDPKICDVFSYGIKSFPDHEVDEALNWCINEDKVRAKWHSLGIEKQNQVLFYAAVGRSLGFR